MLIYNSACNVIMTTFKREKKAVNLLKKVFFNYFDKKSQEAMLKISMEKQKKIIFHLK